MGVRLLMLVSIRLLGDWARNLIIYMVLKGHSPYPLRTQPVKPGANATRFHHLRHSWLPPLRPHA